MRFMRSRRSGSPADDAHRSRPQRLRIRPPIRPSRIVVGGGLIVGSGLGAWALMADASQRDDVLVLRADVPAGAELTADHVGVVAVGSDDDVTAVAASRLDEVVGQFARYRLTAGALLAADNLQAQPLVSPGRALVAVVVEPGDVPVQVAAGDDVALIVTTEADCDDGLPVSIVAGTVTFVPGRSASETEVSLSLEVDTSAVELVATAERVVIARPNSPEVAEVMANVADADACAAEPEPDPATAAADTPSPTSTAAATLPVPTGVTPLQPDEVLTEPTG